MENRFHSRIFYRYSGCSMPTKMHANFYWQPLVRQMTTLAGDLHFTQIDFPFCITIWPVPRCLSLSPTTHSYYYKYKFQIKSYIFACTCYVRPNEEVFSRKRKCLITMEAKMNETRETLGEWIVSTILLLSVYYRWSFFSLSASLFCGCIVNDNI